MKAIYNMKYDILLVGETVNDRMVPSIYELMEFGRQLALHGDRSIALFIPGVKSAEAADIIREEYGISVIAYQNRHLEFINPEILQKGLLDAVTRYDPEYICFIHSVYGSAVAPAIAVASGSSCITGVESFRMDGDVLTFRRRIFGGKLAADVVPMEKRCVLSLMPGSFPPCDPMSLHWPSPASEVIDSDCEPESCFSMNMVREHAGTEKLADADVIISVGRGMGDSENMVLIDRISGIFRKSAVGASRPVCDMGWLPYSQQIGLTGKTVAPKLYMACGISGSPQHIAGMKNSRMIVAINTDPQAAIFAVSHHIIIDDMIQFLTVLEERYNELYRDR